MHQRRVHRLHGLIQEIYDATVNWCVCTFKSNQHRLYSLPRKSHFHFSESMLPATFPRQSLEFGKRLYHRDALVNNSRSTRSPGLFDISRSKRVSATTGPNGVEFLPLFDAQLLSWTSSSANGMGSTYVMSNLMLSARARPRTCDSHPGGSFGEHHAVEVRGCNTANTLFLSFPPFRNPSILSFLFGFDA